MAVGPAIDDVVSYYELPNWIGVSITLTASSLLPLSHDTSDVLVSYNIPYKGGMGEIGWALTWPYYVDGQAKNYYRKILNYRVSYPQKS